jgi:hypothetical protein
MKSKRVLSLLILILIITIAISNSLKESTNLSNSSSIKQIQATTEFDKSYSISQNQNNSQSRLILNKDEVLKKSLKGYREQTYWGSKHPINEKINDLNDKEFNRFVKDEIKSKDVKLYWGSEY